MDDLPSHFWLNEWWFPLKKLMSHLIIYESGFVFSSWKIVSKIIRILLSLPKKTKQVIHDSNLTCDSSIHYRWMFMEFMLVRIISGVHWPGLRRHPDAVLPLCGGPRRHHVVRAGNLSPLRPLAGDPRQLLLHQVRFTFLEIKSILWIYWSTNYSEEVIYWY